jgi:hypothetical protein
VCLALSACTSPSANAARTEGNDTKPVAAATQARPAPPKPATPRTQPSPVRALTGTHTRVVWVQAEGNDPYAISNRLVLMGLDSDDGLGEHAILGERGSYVKPLLISGGKRIIYSGHPKGSTDLKDINTFVVNWDGTGRRQLAEGFALAVWEEPGTGRDWVYLGTDNSTKAAGDFKTVVRFAVDNPGVRELVWNKAPVGGDTFQVSADGRTAGGLFPWPKAGVADLPNGELRILGEGCWTAFRDAGPGLFWFFDGSHRNVIIVDRAGNQRWTVPLNKAPGFNGAEAYHPRWSNHPRFVAISGPYNQGGQNQVRTGGPQAEIWLGRFSPDYRQIEAWTRVTQNNAGDSYPDVWVDRARNPYPAEIAKPTSTAASRDGSRGRDGGRVVVDARLASATMIPAPRSLAPYRNALVVNVYEITKLVEGEYKDRRILVAQWAIRDARVLDEARQRAEGSTARLTLERYDAHPELEGERVIAASGGPDLPLYYDVASRR